MDEIVCEGRAFTIDRCCEPAFTDTLCGSLSVSIAIHTDHLRRCHYPASLERGFEHGSVFISAARFDKAPEPELVIYFGRDVTGARSARVMRHAWSPTRRSSQA